MGPACCDMHTCSGMQIAVACMHMAAKVTTWPCCCCAQESGPINVDRIYAFMPVEKYFFVRILAWKAGADVNGPASTSVVVPVLAWVRICSSLCVGTWCTWLMLMWHADVGGGSRLEQCEGVPIEMVGGGNAMTATHGNN